MVIPTYFIFFVIYLYNYFGIYSVTYISGCDTSEAKNVSLFLWPEFNDHPEDADNSCQM